MAKSLAGIIFLGTPHRDSPKESQASVLAKMVASAQGIGSSEPQRDYLGWDTEVLADLSQEFVRIANAHPIPTFCFWEQPSNMTIAPGAPDPLDTTSFIDRNKQACFVAEQVATLEGFESSVLYTSHYEINDLSHDDPNYVRIRNRVVQIVQDAKACIAKRLKG